MREPLQSFTAGELVAENYRVLEVAGVGGMGTVLRAFDERLQRTVALKFLPVDLGDNPSDKERLLREARTASALDHPNLGSVYGIEETADGRMFLVMPFYEGGSLGEWIRRRQPSLSEKLHLALEIARGLGEAHARGIIHRDIKPSNIMMTTAGVPKVVDFGLAYTLTGETVSRTQTTGTVAYMAPEQAMGRPLDASCDIWALGVVMAEMFTGRHPFHRETLAGILYAILHDPPQYLDGLAPDLQTILFRMLSKDPGSRYGSCQVLTQDLETVLAQMPAPDQPSLPPSGRGQAELRRVRDSAARPALEGTASRRRPFGVWAIGIAGIVIAVCLAAWFIPGVRHTLRNAFVPPPKAQHIAVLPFTGAGNTPDQAALAAGLMESLTNRLANLSSRNPSLWVVPASEVRRRNITDPEVALKDLGSNLVVEGSVQQSGGSTSLQVELVDAAHMRELGSVTLNSASGDVASLETQAVDNLAGMMHVHAAAASAGASASSASPAAYQDYLTALGYIERYDQAGNLDKAINILQQAVQADPNFALGYAELGFADWTKYSTQPDEKWLQQAQAYCMRAIQLDNSLPASYVTLGNVYLAMGKQDLALEQYQQALRLDPRNANALDGLARIHESAGRLKDAEAEFIRAANLQPDNWDGFNALGMFYDRQNKEPQAIAAYQRALTITPDNATVLLNLGGAYENQGDPASLHLAEATLRHSLALHSTYAGWANLGNLYYLERHYQEAMNALRHALQLNADNYLVWDDLRGSCEWMKDKNCVESAKEKEKQLLRTYVKHHPNDAVAVVAYADLLAQAGQKTQAQNYIQTALAISPNDPSTLEGVAVVYENLGNRNEAARYINAAFSKGYSRNQALSDPEAQSLLRDRSVHLPLK